MSDQASPAGVAAPASGRRPLVAALIAFLLAGAAAVGVLRQSEQFRQHEQRTHLADLAAEHADAIKNSTQRALSATYALAALVRQGQGSIANFDAIASELLRYYPGAASLQLAPGGIIQHVVPLAGNEKALGHPLLQDPTRNKEAFLARDSGRLTLAGPFQLIQGGIGAVGRLPVFLNDRQGKPSFWGFTTVLIRYPQAFGEARLAQLTQQGIGYELSRIHPDSGQKQSIAASSATALIDPVTRTLDMPNGQWTLSVAPIKGWHEPLGLTFKSALGLLFSLLLGYLAKLLFELRAHKHFLEALVLGRTSQISATQAKLRATFDAIPDLVWLKDAQGVYLDCNPMFERFLGAKRAAILGKTDHDFMATELANSFRQHDRQAIAAGRARVNEEWLTFADDGRRGLFETTKTPMRDGAGQLIGVLGIAHDITERREAEHQSQASEQRFRDLVNTTDGIVWEADATTFTLTFVSDQAERLLGFSASEWLQPGFWVAQLHPADSTWAPDYCAACTGRLESHDFEYRFIARDGRTVWLRDLVTVVAENGQPRWLRGVMVDITQAKQAQAVLRTNEARYRAVTDSANDAIVTVDSSGKIVHWNPSAQALFGYPQHEAVGMALNLLLPQRWRERHNADFARWRVGAVSPFLGQTFAMMGLRQDGRELPLEVSMAGWETDEGRFITSVIRDISERKRAEEARQESADKLRIMIDAADFYEWEWDVPRDTLTWGRSPSGLLGPPDERTGKYPDFRDLVHPEDRERYLAQAQHTMRTGEPYSVEFRILERDGAVRWIATYGKCVFDSAGAPARMLGVSQDITERKLAQNEIQQLAFTDTLTGLPNRRLLIDRIKHALATSARSQREAALLFIDLDHFKTLNDTRGHATGDLLLQQVTQRLLACVREDDTVARIGGDEFVVLLQDLHEHPPQAAIEVEAVGEKILSALSQVYRLADYVHHSSASIGVALFGPQRESVDELLKHADLAMYSAKAAGRNTLRFFDPQMQTVITTRVTLEADLREALRQDQFVLHYQSQMDTDPVTAGLQLTGAEVLVRWLHPKRGMVSPAEFIPVAEDSGLILPLGHWVLSTACVQLASWATRPDMAHLTLAVNISARQIHHRDFVAQVLAVLETTGANPQRLKLELTESMLVMHVEDVIVKMNALKAAGVGFSLDDFGTGYSSLSYLKRLPLDQLKIDQGFVRDILIDPNDAAIARMVVALAGSLGLTVIAEGVETAAQRAALAGLGCHAYQGYLFSRPLPLAGFEAFVQQL